MAAWTVAGKCALRILLAGSAREKANAKTAYANACLGLVEMRAMCTIAKRLPMVRPVEAMGFAMKKELVFAMLVGLMRLAPLVFARWALAIKYAVVEVYAKRLLVFVTMNSLVMRVNFIMEDLMYSYETHIIYKDLT